MKTAAQRAASTSFSPVTSGPGPSHRHSPGRLTVLWAGPFSPPPRSDLSSVALKGQRTEAKIRRSLVRRRTRRNPQNTKLVLSEAEWIPNNNRIFPLPPPQYPL
jgi:hypothetical protein